MKNIACIEDLRALARRKVPRAFFEYVDGGSYNEETLRANRAELEPIKLRQRVMVDVSERSLATSIIGHKVSAPFALAPIGLCGMQYGDGEILSAQAAEEAGLPFILSTMSINSIEQVAEATTKPFWFQLYVIRDRGFSKDILSRAAKAGCSALVLTVDLQVLGQRHRDIRNGMTVPPQIRLKNIIDMATKPEWVFSILKGKSKTFGNLAGHVKGMDDVTSLAQWTNSQFDPALNWKDVDWIKKIWPGKLIIKGILDVEDAKTAASAGVDGIVVSNHGGRQLDGAHSTIRALPEIASAVRDRIEVLFDGGIRSGQDVVKALAHGAHGCLIGRAYLYGLAANGEAGVRQALDIIRAELEVALTLTGTRDVRAVTGELIGHKLRGE